MGWCRRPGWSQGGDHLDYNVADWAASFVHQWRHIAVRAAILWATRDRKDAAGQSDSYRMLDEFHICKGTRAAEYVRWREWEECPRSFWKSERKSSMHCILWWAWCSGTSSRKGLGLKLGNGSNSGPVTNRDWWSWQKAWHVHHRSH